MDKETLSNYGWIVICVLVLAVMLALATPFGTFVADGFKATYTGLFETGDSALDVGLSAVGVTNTLECGHGRKESGDHSQLDCGHFACEDCGCVPASCGCENHWSGDGLDHTTVVNHSDHTYACECTGWIVPEGGTYTIFKGSTYSAGEQLPCGYVSKSLDRYFSGDYVYEYQTNMNGWWLKINTDVTDKNQTSYGPIIESINGVMTTSMKQTFAGCKNLTTAPAIPNGVTSLYATFQECTSLTDVSNLVIPESVTEMYWAFYQCSNLTKAPDMSQAINVTRIESAFNQCTNLVVAPNLSNCTMLTDMRNAFQRCPNLKTYHGSTDEDGDFSNWIIPENVENIGYAFHECTSLTHAPIIPDSVTNAYYAFLNCNALIDAVEVPCSCEGYNSHVAVDKVIRHVTDCDGTCGY